ncbi:MAG: hypothetical protein HY550_03210 [Elusimicrobia bacterium]|nr:hypothetical protein [Elusimicrobiota bacterium]
MKKNNMLIAVFAVLAAASAAKAEVVDMDFDKGSFSTEKFMEAVKVQEVDRNGIAARTFSVETGNTDDSQADHAIQATIRQCERNKSNEALTGDLKKLLLYGTTEEKVGFITPEKYIFPKRLNAFMLDRSFDRLAAKNKSIGNCVKWESKVVCRDKEIWQTACLAGTVWCFTAAGGSCGPAGATCALVNRIVSECVPVPYCVEWDSEAIPGFGNPGAI